MQGIVTGIRGLCNGLGPALYGLIFFIFHVNLQDADLKSTEDPSGGLDVNGTVAHNLPNIKTKSVSAC